MRKEEVGEASVCGETGGQEAKGVLTHVVVAHINLLNIAVVLQGLRDGLDLLVCQLVLQKV